MALALEVAEVVQPVVVLPPISVVLPSYNESLSVAGALLSVEKSLGDQLLEILVVDDDSPDLTWKIVEDMRHPRCRVLRRTDDRGLAAAYAAGFAQTKGEVVAWLDVDLAEYAEIVTRLAACLDHYDLAIASRYVAGGGDNRTRARALISRVLNAFARLLLGAAVRDYTSGIAAARRDVLLSIPWKPHGHGEYFVELVHRARQMGFRVVEIPFVLEPRKLGTSKTDGNVATFLRLGIQYVFKIIKLAL
ncbi:MAG: glycosyltransferase [Planctomycetes bacterium]|nr:glycosyltransferase [Planctomycetota bacterium]